MKKAILFLIIILNCSTVLSGRRTLVHCTRGVSRSGIATVLAYAKLHNVTLDAAINMINADMPIVGG